MINKISKLLPDNVLNNSDTMITKKPDKKIKNRYLFTNIFSLENKNKKQEIKEIIKTYNGLIILL